MEEYFIYILGLVQYKNKLKNNITYLTFSFQWRDYCTCLMFHL